MRGGVPLCTFMREAGDPSQDGAELAGIPCRRHNDVHFKTEKTIEKTGEGKNELGEIEEADQQRCLLEKRARCLGPSLSSNHLDLAD
jgi:hypothetical protein